MQPKPYPRFESIDFICAGADDLVQTTLDRDCDHFRHLVGKVVVVDTVELLCTAVLCAAAGPPFKKGAEIALTFKPAPLEILRNGGTVPAAKS